MLSAAAVSSLHPERFAVGSAVNQTARQVGGAFGVALLVVILGTPHTATAALDNFRHLWWYAASMALLSGLACTLLRPARLAVLRQVAPGESGARGQTSAAGRAAPAAVTDGAV